MSGWDEPPLAEGAPDPPSYSHTPPPELTEGDRDAGVRARAASARAKATADAASEQLATLLSAADDDDEAAEIVEAFGTPAGRHRLVHGSAPARPAAPRAPLRAAGTARQPIVLSDSDDSVSLTVLKSGGPARGVKTRRGTVVASGARAPPRRAARSAPLPARRTQRRRENFVDRNRRQRIEHAIDMTGEARSGGRCGAGPNSSRQGGVRRSTRLRRTVLPELDEEESGSDGTSGRSDCSLRSTGSGGVDDPVETGSEDEPVLDIDEWALAAEAEEESDDEEADETFAIKRVRVKRPTPKGRGGKHSRCGSVDEDRSPASRKGAHKHKRKPDKSPSKDFLGRKTKRRRTDPNSVFEAPENLLTAEERKNRLDALVKQTAEINVELNKVMTDAAAGTKTRAKAVLLAPTKEGASLQPHQVDGVRWLLTLDNQGLNAILADEMGLGKTIQSVAFLATVLTKGNRGPHIVIAPKNVVPHWANEVQTWYPGKFKVVTHIGAGAERFDRMKTVFKIMPDFDILVTSFDLAMRDFFTKPRPENQTAWESRKTIRMMHKLEFEYAIVDEAHRLKNSEAKFTAGLRKFTQARRRLLLTGTPLSNNLQELWALMNVLNPRIFGSQGTFDAWFAAPFDTNDKRNSLSIGEQSLIVDRLHTVLRPFFRRRLRADVCPSFSSADEVVIKCPQSALQKALHAHYRSVRRTREHSVCNIVMELRKVANHPYIVSNALFQLPETESPRTLVGMSGKFLFLYHSLPRLIEAGHRVLIFSQFRLVLDFVEDLLEMLNVKYGRLDGMTTNDDREDTVAKFNEPGCDIPVFILTTRAGGVGLNLQSADTVILFDSDWNPSADLQAVSRIQRIGQKRTVHIMRLVTTDSVDEIIVEKGMEKLRTEAVAVAAGKFNANVDPNADANIRQRDLEAILAEFEARQNKQNSPDPEAVVPSDGTSPSKEGSSKDASKDSEPAALSKVVTECFKEWDPKLLRKGETELPAYSGTVQPLLETEKEVPQWIRKGCDPRCAALALKCRTFDEVPAALEKGRLLNDQKNGILPVKRERRSRFNFLNAYDGISDDSNAEHSESDEEARISDAESEESEDSIFLPTPEKSHANGKGSVKPRKPKHSKLEQPPVPVPSYEQYAKIFPFNSSRKVPFHPANGRIMSRLTHPKPTNSNVPLVAPQMGMHAPQPGPYMPHGTRISQGPGDGFAPAPLYFAGPTVYDPLGAPLPGPLPSGAPRVAASSNLWDVIPNGQARTILPVPNGPVQSGSSNNSRRLESFSQRVTPPNRGPLWNQRGRQFSETKSPAGIPVIDLNSDSDDGAPPQQSTPISATLQRPNSLYRSRQLSPRSQAQRMHLHAVAVAEQRSRERDAARYAARARVAQAKLEAKLKSQALKITATSVGQKRVPAEYPTDQRPHVVTGTAAAINSKAQTSKKPMANGFSSLPMGSTGASVASKSSYLVGKTHGDPHVQSLANGFPANGIPSKVIPPKGTTVSGVPAINVIPAKAVPEKGTATNSLPASKVPSAPSAAVNGTDKVVGALLVPKSPISPKTIEGRALPTKKNNVEVVRPVLSSKKTTYVFPPAKPSPTVPHPPGKGPQSTPRRSFSTNVLAAPRVIAKGATTGADQNLLNRLQEFSGVVDRELLAEVLVACDNDIASAAHFVWTCQ